MLLGSKYNSALYFFCVDCRLVCVDFYVLSVWTVHTDISGVNFTDVSILFNIFLFHFITSIIAFWNWASMVGCMLEWLCGLDIVFFYLYFGSTHKIYIFFESLLFLVFVVMTLEGFLLLISLYFWLFLMICNNADEMVYTQEQLINIAEA